VEDLIDLVQPWALEELAAHRAEGRLLVLATTSPHDLVDPLASALGFDDVLATRYQEIDGHYTGRLVGRFIWGTNKRDAARDWAAQRGIDLADCHAYSDSFFDVPLLSAVGTPHAVNADPRLVAVAMARRWPLEHWDRPPGVPSVIGLEPYHLLRPFIRPESFPYARFTVNGIEPRAPRGTGHPGVQPPQLLRRRRPRLVAARLGRPVRFMGKQELFDAPVVARSPAPWVDPGRRGSGSGDRCAGPPPPSTPARWSSSSPGHHPPGRAFFDPVLHGKTGAARLAADTGAPVVPIGVWGTERCGPARPRCRT